MADQTEDDTSMDWLSQAGSSESTAPPQSPTGQRSSTASAGQTDASADHHMTTEVSLLRESTYSNSSIGNPLASSAIHSSVMNGQNDSAGSSEMSVAQTDLGVWYISVQWPNNGKPQKPTPKLQKALQSWFNKNMEIKTKISCHCVPLVDDDWFSLRMSASQKNDELLHVLDTLPKDLELGLEVGEGKLVGCKVQFHKTSPRHFDTQRSASDIKTPDNIPKKEKDADTSACYNGMVTSGQAGNECSVPLQIYWYMSSAYQKELQNIERKYQVKILESVNVTIEGSQDPTNPHTKKALEELTDLFQQNTGDLDSHCVSLDQVHSKDLLGLLKMEPRVQLSCSSDKLLIYGPSKSIRRVRTLLGSNSSTDRTVFSGAAGCQSKDQPQNITMDIRDPLVTKGISMPLSLWKLLKEAFGQNIHDIQEKFGVEIKFESFHGKVLVRALLGDRQAVSLESHALRALMHIYQRVSTSIMSCSLLVSEQKAAVEDTLKKIHPQHPHVWSEVTSDSLRLFGLPEHLGPAVTALERQMGRPVFKEEDKQKIPYPGVHRSTPASDGGADSNRRAEGGATASNDEECCICQEQFKDKKKIPCNHEFCSDCLKRSMASMGPTCPLCKHVFGEMKGDQPDGMMNVSTQPSNLPGFYDCGTIVIHYQINGGIQSDRHPNPGKPFYATTRTAYLPDNKEGQEVLWMLRKAFDQKLIFTIGTSRTSGVEDSVTWNDIHHKTSMYGGPERYGYPDDNYLTRVKDELKSKGIVPKHFLSYPTTLV